MDIISRITKDVSSNTKSQRCQVNTNFDSKLASNMKSNLGMKSQNKGLDLIGSIEGHDMRKLAVNMGILSMYGVQSTQGHHLKQNIQLLNAQKYLVGSAALTNFS